MVGFALEGGGAKGAYQAGAYIALVKNKIKPSIIAGTSIGSLNAALMAQGDINKLVDLWLNTTVDIFGINSELIEKVKTKNIKKEDIILGYENVKTILKNKGIDTDIILKTIKENINEKKLRKSKIKFGLVTVKLKGMKPLELTIDDIPYGKVAEFILASCYLPIFNFKPIIDDCYYIDGGFYNNIPLSLVEKYGCDTIYSIRIKGPGISHNKLKKTTKVIEIKPSRNLGSIIFFDREKNINNMLLGYYDTLRVINKVDGENYYFKKKKIKYYNKIVKKIDIDKLSRLKKIYFVKDNKELTIKIVEKILKQNNIDNLVLKDIKKEIKYIKKNIEIKEKHLKEFIFKCKLY